MGMERFNKKLHIARRGVVYSLVLCCLILLIGGLGFWMLDPGVDTLSDGLWLAFTTAATVGYGDVVPSTPASRGFAVVVVLLGLAVLSLATASLAAIFCGKRRGRRRRPAGARPAARDQFAARGHPGAARRGAQPGPTGLRPAHFKGAPPAPQMKTGVGKQPPCPLRKTRVLICVVSCKLDFLLLCAVYQPAVEQRNLPGWTKGYH